MAEDYDEFGPYRVYECLGTGGMATVHRAIYDDGELVREVALKRLLPQHQDDKTFVEDFVREGKLAQRLSHPAIVRIFELGRIDSAHFIAMELVVGQPLMHLIRAAHYAKKQTPIGVVIALMAELCDALDYACNGNDRETGDRLNIVHRDLSPSNLIVTDEGHLKIIDFGVAKATAGARFTTSTGLVKGKLGYMAVEALAGQQVDGRSDVFSVGVVAWELVTGRRLFTGKNELEVIQRVREGHVLAPSQYNPACLPTLDAIIQQALAKQRDDRWATAGAMRQAIEAVRRAYREEATPEAVVAWAQSLAPAPAPSADMPKPASVPVPRDFARPDSDSERTMHRARPMRASTMIDLDEEEAANAMIAAHKAGQTAQSPRNFDLDEPDLTFGDEGTASEPRDNFAEMTLDGVPPPMSMVIPPRAFDEDEGAGQTFADMRAMEDVPSVSVTMEVLQLDEVPDGRIVEEVLQLEETMPVPELLDLEGGEATSAGATVQTPAVTPVPNDTVVVKQHSEHRPRRKPLGRR